MRRLLAIFPLFFFLTNGQGIDLNCEGGFDIYMLIDQSNSIGAVDRVRVADFLLLMKDKYKDRPGFRMAIYTFGSVAFPVLPLTSDLTQVDKAIAVMKTNTIGAGMTQMAKGMEFAILEMSNPDNRNRNKLLFLLTDGQMTALSTPVEDSEVVFWANKAREVQCTVISVGVGPEDVLDIPLLEGAANKPSANYSFTGIDFDKLSTLLDNFNIGTTCVNLTALAQECGPLIAGTPLVITAVGWTTQAFYPQVTRISCEYSWHEKEKNMSATTQAEFDASTEEISCPSPNQDIDNTTKAKVIYTTDAGDGSFALVTPILIAGSLSEACFVPPPKKEPFPYWILFLIALLLLFLLWFFFPKMPAKKTFEEAVEEFDAPQIEETIVAPIAPAHTPLPPPVLPPPKQKKKVRKWAKVDTSHYIWARDGGTARPMEVGWGATGAPESAPVKKGDVEYITQQEAAPTVVKEEEPSAAFVPQEEPIENFEAEEEFEERQWDRCCCGLCRSDACDCCKRSLMATFFCCSFTGAICNKFCKPCAAIYNCFDKCRPRWDCCGVSGGKDKNTMEMNPVNYQ